ncbi:2OG-Fe(II) oxygenase [Mucilaginibacter paludis]|uniref:Prolyl 4-hydroxylase alpha subunit Fe(2+) 2OG dioxygenase domain-containing protein n=1 Tax=Mucilaginibacter paludis DSM 18603 TaxID=714943 RepID=H1YGE8_9SPHI|nr:2OG-Fe(II) oxygenase [Mucilaginibacter paludis]EHQ24500.1 hypothetical protein Mucpa_0304 [Mucilaginibacter paludis DSM 18603]
MSDFKKQLLGVLNEIKGSGSFVTTGSKSFVFPGLEVRGVGEIGFPVNAVQVTEMIKGAHQAPFGKGSETILDTNVRSAWEIDADQIVFSNSDWSKFIETLVEQVKPDLGISEHSVSAHLYKLLIYEQGDFFLAHKDSEKEKGMFGTLIVGLPSRHTGGELSVRFDGKTETIDFSVPASNYKIPFAAFYADCEHEILPLTSGYRVCLVYNLVQNKGTEKIGIHQLGGYVDRLADILKTHEDDQGLPKMVLLGHQYTPSNFTIAALKLNDRPKAESLLLAAEKAGYYAKMGLITSFLAGQLEVDYARSNRHGKQRQYNPYDDEYDDDLSAEDGVMGEVYDDRIDIEHWMPGGVPPLQNIAFDEELLITDIELNEGEPIQKEAEGYTGNAGMEMYYWYHYGAVFLWPKKYHYQMLTEQGTENKLEWIAWYNERWDAVSGAERKLIERLITEDVSRANLGKEVNCTPLADWLINLNDEQYVFEKGTVILTNNFSQIAVEAWLKLFELYTASCFEPVFAEAGAMGQSAIVRHWLAILNSLPETGRYEAFVMGQAERIPGNIKALNLPNKDGQTVIKDILRNVLTLSKLKDGDNTWLKNTIEAFTRVLTRNYVNKILVEVLLEWGAGLPLAKQMMAVCKEHLVYRVDHKPQPPADWSRAVPSVSNYKKQWALLADFLQSPTQQIFDYQRVQAERDLMEDAIRAVTIDLDMETIKKGSPHTLRITKNQNAYEAVLADWKADVALLKQVSDFQFL